MPDEQHRLVRLEGEVAELRERVDAMQRILDDMQIDVAGIIRELRINLLPGLLPERRAYVGHGAVLRPRTRKAIRQQTAALARAAKPVGVGPGTVNSLETKHRLRREAKGK